MNPPARLFFGLGACLALLSVGAGAFGAHALRARLDPAMLEVFETGARYQMYHALGLMAVAWAANLRPSGSVRLAGWLFVLGIVLFSGSLYLLALGGLGAFGIVTPFGGVAMMAGWGCLAYWAFTARD
ncbi:MAG: DUF423 domain-containing protein [Limnobacter sp.]|nr:DUF423 domain-containing protein [Limnobacter sp.]